MSKINTILYAGFQYALTNVSYFADFSILHFF